MRSNGTQTGVDRLRGRRPDGWWKLDVAEAGGRGAPGAGSPGVGARRRARRIVRGSRPGDVVVLGDGGEPFPGRGETRKVARECLGILLDGVGLSLFVLTRSPAILEDLDLILAFPRVTVGVALPSVGPRLARRLEPGLPDPRARLSLLRKLVRKGVSTGLDLHPVFPGMGDRLGTLRRVAETAADAGAKWFRVRGLRLTGDGRILDIVSECYPGLARLYAQRFGPEGKPPRSWEARLQSMASSLRAETGLAAGPFATSSICDQSTQLRLPFRARAAGRRYALTGSPG